MPEDTKKELPVATISAIEKDYVSLIIEVDGKEQTFRFKTTSKVEDWISKNPSMFHKNAVVEYSAKAGTISLIRPARSFKKASEQSGQIVNLDAVAQAKTTVPPPQTAPALYAKAPQIQLPPKEVIGSFDPAKIHGYEVTDTCQVVQFEPITIKVIGDDPETCRRALIEAWQCFGQNSEVTRETVRKHVMTHLLKEK